MCKSCIYPLPWSEQQKLMFMVHKTERSIIYSASSPRCHRATNSSGKSQVLMRAVQLSMGNKAPPCTSQLRVLKEAASGKKNSENAGLSELPTAWAQRASCTCCMQCCTAAWNYSVVWQCWVKGERGQVTAVPVWGHEHRAAQGAGALLPLGAGNLHRKEPSQQGCGKRGESCQAR